MVAVATAVLWRTTCSKGVNGVRRTRRSARKKPREGRGFPQEFLSTTKHHPFFLGGANIVDMLGTFEFWCCANCNKWGGWDRPLPPSIPLQAHPEEKKIATPPETVKRLAPTTPKCLIDPALPPGRGSMWCRGGGWTMHQSHKNGGEAARTKFRKVRRHRSANLKKSNIIIGHTHFATCPKGTQPIRHWMSE